MPSGTPTLTTLRDGFTKTSKMMKSFSGSTQENILKEHQGIHTGEKPHQCSHCGKWRTRPIDLWRQCENSEYRCSECVKNSERPSYLKQHRLIRTGEKPFSCSHRRNGFTRRSHLRQHVRIRTGDKPCRCSHCGRSFAHLSRLQMQKRRPISACSVASVLVLRQNLRIHTGQKP